MAIVVKTIGGRQYRYLQTSKRVNGKVVTSSTYLGPVTPRRRGGGFSFIVRGVVTLGAKKAKDKIEDKKEGRGKGKYREPLPPRLDLPQRREGFQRDTLTEIQRQAAANRKAPRELTEGEKEDVKAFQAVVDRARSSVSAETPGKGEQDKEEAKAADARSEADAKSDAEGNEKDAHKG